MHNFTTPDSEQRDQLMLWSTAPDLETLIRLNTKYIKDELRIHPAHSHPVDPETKDISSSLLQMNQYGLFTFSGQPQDNGGSPQSPSDSLVCDGMQVDQPEACRHRARLCFHTDQWTETRQLAYVQFSTSIGYPGVQSDLSHAKWEQVPSIWSEVNDYHLLVPRMPTWFFPSDATTPFVFGVNAIEHDIELDIQLLILEAVEASILAKSLPVVVPVPWTIQAYKAQHVGWIAGGITLFTVLGWLYYTRKRWRWW
ncbi:hypothetical protein LTR97_012785 [Elasticomyces elasticus]|uniref:DUF6919 domain-containing protein n=1 Tax=Elasticomyces elasticus TaxID=574655 RepID=A0AAN7VZ95_9PEZI|nr:hypothetical protein LTR97_012785 [Elasticomyces elasticus]